VSVLLNGQPERIAIQKNDEGVARRIQAPEPGVEKEEPIKAMEETLFEEGLDHVQNALAAVHARRRRRVLAFLNFQTHGGVTKHIKRGGAQEDGRAQSKPGQVASCERPPLVATTECVARQRDGLRERAQQRAPIQEPGRRQQERDAEAVGLRQETDFWRADQAERGE
jgi:hypothetical protein